MYTLNPALNSYQDLQTLQMKSKHLGKHTASFTLHFCPPFLAHLQLHVFHCPCFLEPFLFLRNMTQLTSLPLEEPSWALKVFQCSRRKLLASTLPPTTHLGGIPSISKPGTLMEPCWVSPLQQNLTSIPLALGVTAAK